MIVLKVKLNHWDCVTMWENAENLYDRDYVLYNGLFISLSVQIAQRHHLMIQ